MVEAKPKPSRPTRTWVTQPGHSKFSFPTGSSPPFREAPPWWPPLTRRRSWDVQDAPNHPYNRDRLHVRGYRVSGTRRGQHSPPDPYTGLSLPPSPTHASQEGSPSPSALLLHLRSFFSSLQGAELPRKKMQSPKGTTSRLETGSAKGGVLFLPEGVL